MKLADFACKHWQSKGRLYNQSTQNEGDKDASNILHNLRSVFQHDRDRIIHARAFRRLKHKTQVLSKTTGDHHRTRLTHSLEVAQIARSLARSLAVDEDLTEAIALAHDIGHPPFGHAGEDVLAHKMRNFGGFDHNDQAIRIVALLEISYPDFDGLNLSFEMLDGIIKHNGPALKPGPNVALLAKQMQIDLNTQGSLEAQIAAISDDIAYNHHDLDDGLRIGLFSIDDVCQNLPYIENIYSQIKTQWPDLDLVRTKAELIRRLIHQAAEDAIMQTKQNLQNYKIQSLEDIFYCSKQLVSLSPLHTKNIMQLHQFLMIHMYKANDVLKLKERNCKILTKVFDYYIENPHHLPEKWKDAIQMNQSNKARRVCDYIAGMSDTFVFTTHQNLLSNHSTLS